MIDLRNKKTKKVIVAIVVLILVLAMIVPTLIFALQGSGIG